MGLDNNALSMFHHDQPVFVRHYPLSFFEEETEKEEEYTVVEKQDITYHAYTYQLQKGDMLFQFSVKYYNSRKGEDLIKSWNNITYLEGGMTIEIPVPIDSEN
jgi:type IV pilus assembly protein PilO